MLAVASAGLKAQNWPIGEKIFTLPIPPPIISLGSQNDTGEAIDCIFFYDTLHGVIAAGYDSGSIHGKQIYYTSDTKIWKLATLPPGIVQVNAIRNINGKLYAAVFGPDIIISTDSGATWSYTGLNLPDAWDVYAEPSGNITTFKYARRAYYYGTFARVDQLHCLWTDDVNPVQASDDGGVTWHSIGIYSHDGRCCYGDTCTKVFVFDGSVDTDSAIDELIYRSTDFGNTWQKQDVGEEEDPIYLEGAAGVIYTDAGEVSRSTDDGKTWELLYSSGSFIDGGSGDLYSHFPVLGLTGNYVVYASGYTNDIYLLNIGGNGSYGDSIAIPSTEDLFACGTITIPVPIFGTADSMISSVTITDSSNEFSLTGATTFVLHSGSHDTVWVSFSPKHYSESSSVTINFQNSWHCSDWSETRTIIVTTPPSALAIAPQEVSGGCKVVSDSGFFQIDSCQTLVLTNVSIAQPITNRLLFQFALTDTIGNSNHNVLLFQFDPRDTDADGIASVKLQGFYLGTSVPFDTTLRVHITAVRVAPQLVSPIYTLDFGALSTFNGAGDSTLTFTNTGCAPDTITSLTLTGAGFTGVHDSLPIIVAPGDSVTLQYRFVPPDSGAFTGQVNLNVVSMGLTEHSSVSLSGSGVQGLGILDVRSMGLQAGSFSFCAGDTTITDTISNTGCDTLVISNINFNGDAAFSLVSASGDSLLLPGSTRVFQFTFAPRVKGAQSAMLTFHSRNIVNDPGHDTTITLAGIGLGGTKILAADTSLRDFGALYACQSRDTTVTLHNAGCDTLFIDSGLVTNGSYATNAVYPIILPPGDSAMVQVSLAADSAGMNGTLVFFSNANQGDDMVTIPVTASIIPPARLVLDLSPSDTATDGALVTCYVLLEGTVPSGAISGLQFEITHNDDLLTLLNVTGAGLTRVRLAGSPASTRDLFTWVAPTSALRSDTIGMISFQVYLSDSSFTPLTLSNVTFTNSRSLADNCIASIVDSGASFTYLYKCGEPLIQDAMLGTLPFVITGIVPNPAADEITISLAGWNAGEGSIVGDASSIHAVSVEMYDALGRSVLTPASPQPLSLLGEGLAINVTNVPSGIYFIRVSSGGYVQSRSVVIAH